MKKSILLALLSFLVFLTVILVLTGFIFQKEDYEKQNGLSNEYDVSSQNTIAYVTYHDGKPQLRLYNKKLSIEETIFELSNKERIQDPSFSSDGSRLVFISSAKDLKDNISSTVYLLDLRTKEMTTLFKDKALVTEIDFSPDQNNFYFLKANTFENYSPIASERPHELDVYQYNLLSNTQTQITDFKNYSMNSLTVSADGKEVYIQMDDDANVESPEDTFNMKQRIFEIPLEYPEQKKVISDKHGNEDVFDFTFTPLENEIILQKVSETNSDGIYVYELFSYNLNTKEEKQLTNIHEYTESPVVSSDGKVVYFIVDKNFAGRNPDYYLYQININGNQSKEIKLPQ
jgi:Tol biopolymer transport system component